jgi:hypothetical protein
MSDMKYRKLRITWLVCCGILCLLLIALWARSYWWSDWIGRFDQTKLQTSIGSSGGDLICARVDWSSERGGLVAPHGWQYDANKITFPTKSHWMNWSNNTGPGFRFAISHWLVIPLFAALAAAPWLPWRFSLRTLLIAITVFALLLGFVIWIARN